VRPGTAEGACSGEPQRTTTRTDAVVALRDFLNSLDFSGRKLKLVKQA